jgi:hypothetical protein
MTIVFDATQQIKPVRPFGEGILRRERFVPSPEDEAWWSANAPSNVEPEPDWDFLAAEAEALDRLERGLCL